jgi:hypothetical protein
MMENFEQVITNVFQPLFEVTKDPSSHPKPVVEGSNIGEHEV